MKRHVMLVLPVLALTLGACAPSATGGSRPMEISPLETVQMKPGQTLFVSTKYPVSALKLDQKFMDGVLKVDFSNRDLNKNVKSVRQRAAWLKMKPESVPEGWNISLAYADAVREIEDTRNDSSSTIVSFRDYIQAVYSISVPQNAAAGERVLMVTLDDGAGHTTTVPVSVQVGDSGGTTAQL